MAKEVGCGSAPSQPIRPIRNIEICARGYKRCPDDVKCRGVRSGRSGRFGFERRKRRRGLRSGPAPPPPARATRRAAGAPPPPPHPGLSAWRGPTCPARAASLPLGPAGRGGAACSRARARADGAQAPCRACSPPAHTHTQPSVRPSPRARGIGGGRSFLRRVRPHRAIAGVGGRGRVVCVGRSVTGARPPLPICPVLSRGLAPLLRARARASRRASRQSAAPPRLPTANRLPGARPAAARPHAPSPRRPRSRAGPASP